MLKGHGAGTTRLLRNRQPIEPALQRVERPAQRLLCGIQFGCHSGGVASYDQTGLFTLMPPITGGVRLRADEDARFLDDLLQGSVARDFGVDLARLDAFHAVFTTS